MRILYQSPIAHSWIRQRPQEIAEGLAKCGHRVFWFYAGNCLKTSFHRFDDGKGFSGMELPVLPFASRCRPVEWLNHLWCSWWLRRLKVDVVIATNPVALPWLPSRFFAAKVVYDCMDVQSAFFTGRRRRRMIETERHLLECASRIVASSEGIRASLVENYHVGADRVVVIPNGVSLGNGECGTDSRVPVSHPSIAYFGTLAPWFDWSSVRASAAAHPDWHFDLFGPLEGTVDNLPANIRLRGPIPHAQVLVQARASDVLVMPFLRNELIDGVDPVKMYEYLQIGRPIVSSWWPLLDKFKRFAAVRFYDAAITLETRIEEALEGPAVLSVPMDFLEANAWPRRIEALDGILRGDNHD